MMIAATDQQAVLPTERQAYSPPVLRDLGDVRMVTLGGSAGRGDSGSASTQRTMRL